MIFSNATEYAIRGLAELACRSHGDGRPVMLDQLVEGTDIPRDFLAKIFQRLVRGGILTSTKGRGGGFSLARPDHEITNMQNVECVE
jgi:Rrf2 family protein